MTIETSLYHRRGVCSNLRPTRSIGLSEFPIDRELFMRLLGRPPDAAESAKLADPDLALRLTASPEYRNRFRDAAISDAEILTAVRLWPLADRDYDLQIFMVSGEGLSKCRPGIDRLLSELTPRTLLTVLCGEDEGVPLEAPNAELVVVPGASVFDLRARLPEFAKEAGWIALIEDHAVPHPGWVAAALGAIRNVPDDSFAFTGVVTNEVSTSPWSWANFLFNFVFHWAPTTATTLPGTVTTLVFRRDLIGRRPLQTHFFEFSILSREGPVQAAMQVDHCQPVTWLEASAHVFDNGLVAGSSVRRHHPSPRRAVFESIRWVHGGRIARTSAALATHPRRAELPRNIVGMIRWIGLCHSAGVIIGATFGAGRAQHRLE
jgi:hypothetical protein